jgi:hypothetical protein
MFILIEVSDAERIDIIPHDGAPAVAVREVGRGPTLADIAHLAAREHIKAHVARLAGAATPTPTPTIHDDSLAIPAPTLVWSDPDNDELDPDEPTVLAGE